MALDIELKIYMPEKLVLDKKVYRAVLPYEGKTLTAIKDRAPTLMTLDLGVIQILDENDNASDEWLIAGGAADIKENVCTVLTEAAFHKNDLDLEKARALNEEFANPFYEWLVGYFEKEQQGKTKR